VKNIVTLLCCLFAIASTAQVPKMGNDTLLDVANWNIEWFGNTTPGNGPDDEVTQFNNVKTILLNTDIDVWGLAEVSDNGAWMNLTAALPAYGNTISTYSQTQKTALIWKKNKFDMLSSQHVLSESQYSYDFASRPPLEVVLVSKNTTVVDTIYFYVLHLKAYADQTSYSRRQNASGFLKTFLETNRPGKKVIVLGDWNDEVNGSTVSGNNSPFLNFLNDTARYFFVSKLLSDQGKKTYVSTSGKVIDHQMITKSLYPFYVPSSVKVLDNLPSYVTNYSTTTSDHYPIMAFYNLKRYTPNTGISSLEENQKQITVYPNPANDYLTIETGSEWQVVNLFDLYGKTISFYSSGNLERKTIQTASLSNGMYFLRLQNKNGQVLTHKIQIEH
jgi:hypothetical protein